MLDLTVTDGDLKGFQGGFASNGYGYFVPYYNGAYFGKVARVHRRRSDLTLNVVGSNRSRGIRR